MYPDIQTKVRAEIEQVLGNSQDIEESQLHLLSYCKNLLNETLRLRPPVNSKINKEISLNFLTSIAKNSHRRLCTVWNLHSQGNDCRCVYTRRSSQS